MRNVLKAEPPADPTEERITALMLEWPTLEQSLGCMDCKRMIRRAVRDECPLCGSSSLLNVGSILDPDEVGRV